ncbi:MAG: DUF1365 domain-containing protein [Rickettsiales bacterium]|nr:DUF1365 domain-containing protein [Rickettsiales bacterium]
MELEPKMFVSKVMHKRLKPKINQFTYGVYYIASPLSQLNQLSDGWRFGVNQTALLSLYAKDHGNRADDNLEQWIRDILSKYNVSEADGEIILVCMPRVLGYVFNPISLWLCLDKQQQLRAVLCEVNNTFGETHSYLCVKPDHTIISSNDWLEATKLFHVSPFFERDGHYRFRFAYTDTSLGVWIDYCDDADNKQLLTSLVGSLTTYNRKNRQKAFWKHPLVTFKTISLIHWQALKLVLKGIKYVSRPVQDATRLSITKK